MTLAVYHVHGTVYLPYATEPEDRVCVGVCADGKTEAAKIVRERLLRDGYSRFMHSQTDRVAAAGNWEPGLTLRYY